ncbi:hypothetical protein H5P36_25910 [Bacillus sp. APMAM]|nr:hypothetical protein [Bacillus sp. APMAM]RTZ51708.1 hypothetical protein EKO25_25755 [Bacillus sp. SAJ1]
MKQLSVSQDAIKKYIGHFKNEIAKTISGLYNEDFVYSSDDKKFSFVFLNDFTLVLVAEKETIVDISPLNYDTFISDDFIKKIMDSPSLSPRLNRYKELGINRFKEEIIENFRLGNMCIDNSGKVSWEDYNLTFRLNDSLMLESLNH